MAGADSEKAFNVLNHGLVPIHEALTLEEQDAFVERMDIVPEQLPKIMVTDPAALAAGAKAGQIVRIRRKSKTAGEAVAYRLVIDNQV
jgi:DNA-directed RNA polymerase subunit H